MCQIFKDIYPNESILINPRYHMAFKHIKGINLKVNIIVLIRLR